MTPSEYIKSKGLPSLAYVSRQTGVIERTLFNWYHNKHQLFKTVIFGRLLMALIPKAKGVWRCEQYDAVLIIDENGIRMVSGTEKIINEREGE